MTIYEGHDQNRHCTLSDIIKGVLYSVNSSQVVLEQHFDKILRKYFTRDGKPLTTKFMVDSERFVEVPLITLVNLSALALKELNLEMSLHVDEVSVRKIEDSSFDSEISRGSFNVSIAPSLQDNCSIRPADMVDVSMKFTAIDPPEGISRVLDEYIKKI